MRFRRYLYTQTPVTPKGELIRFPADSAMFDSNADLVINLLLRGATITALNGDLSVEGEIATLDNLYIKNKSNDFIFVIHSDYDSIESFTTTNPEQALSCCVDSYVVEIYTEIDGYLATI